jgi:hypothetical protein
VPDLKTTMSCPIWRVNPQATIHALRGIVNTRIMTRTRSMNPMPSLFRLMCLVAVVSFIASCSSTPPPKKDVPPAVVIEVPAPPARFTIHAPELDVWNAVGQLLVRMDGVTYETRAQKLGLYAVEYRGEKFLILTKALLLSSEIKSLTTEVRGALPTGKTSSSAPARELLDLLQARLPAELIRLASEKKKPAVKKAAKKVKKKPSARG